MMQRQTLPFFWRKMDAGPGSRKQYHKENPQTCQANKFIVELQHEFCVEANTERETECIAYERDTEQGDTAAYDGNAWK